MPSVMTIAVRMSASGKGSDISSAGVRSMIGGPPARPPESSSKRLTPLPSSTTPMMMRVSERSRMR